MTSDNESNGKIEAKDRDDGGTQDETWLEVVERDIEAVATQPPPVLFLEVLKLELPYIVMLATAIVGIGLSTFTGELMPLYWEVSAPVYGVICVYAGWRHAEDREARTKLLWTQAAHWLAVLLTMYVVYLPQVRDVMNTNAAGITLMAILALATILAGIHAEAWQICAVGIILGGAIPIIAWIQVSALFMTVSAIVVVFVAFVAASLWWTMRKQKQKLAQTA